VGFGTWGNGRPTFRHPSRGFQDVMAAAVEGAGSGGIDSLDLLIATAAADQGEQLLTRLGASRVAIEIAALRAHPGREPSPGLSIDAKVAIETAVNRALRRGVNPDIPDVLVGLVLADCLARPVLAAHGVSADRLLELVGGG
jgi:hypothetical protein